MGQTTIHFVLLNLISAAVTPIVLVTASSILLSNHTAKYNAISMQMRGLTAEYRAPATTEQRRASLHRQLLLFRRRIRTMWTASTCLYTALLCFISTVLAVVFVTGVGVVWLDPVGGVTLIAGLLMMGLVALLELHEVRLAHQTAADELHDLVM